MSYARSAVTRMTLDMSRLDLQRSETVTLGDTNRRWEVTLINGGAPFRLPPNWTAALTGIKPDGNGLQNGCSVVDGKIVYDFAAGKEIATCVGSYPVQFDIWDEVGELVASPKVYINVLADVRPHAELESNGQYTLIGDAIKKITDMEKDVDLLGDTALAQGDDIAALKKKVTTAGSVTIPASEWTDTIPKLAYPEQPVLAKGTVALMMPGDTASQNAARKAKITVQAETYGGGKIVVQREDGDAPTGNITLNYIIIKVDNPEASPKAALIGVDAYGEEGGTASGVDEAAVRSIIKQVMPVWTQAETPPSETDPTVSDWAKAKTKPTYTAHEVGLGKVANVRQYSADNPPPYPVTSVNGQVGVVNLPIPSEAADVRADPEGTAEAKIKDHNTDNDAHEYIQQRIDALRTLIENFLDVDNESLDQLSEILRDIRANTSALELLGTNKVDKTAISTSMTDSNPEHVASMTLIVALDNALTVVEQAIEDLKTNKQTAEQVSAAINNALSGYLTSVKAAELYQPKGDYILTADADNKYVGKESGKGLSSNDYSNAEKAKVAAAITQHQDISHLLPINQGAANAGKLMMVADDGSVTYIEIADLGLSGGDVIGNIDSDKNIVLTGDLAPGTYTFAYLVRKSDGTTETVTIGTYTVEDESETKTYTITWVVDGKTTTETYEEGETPTFKGSTDKAADDEYTYTFAGWSPEIKAVKADATYTATYTQTAKPTEPTQPRNFANPAGSDWVNGTRLTTDINQTKALTGGASTNYIDIQSGDTVTCSGINFEDGNNRIAADGSTGGIAKATDIASAWVSNGYVRDVTYDSNSVTLTVTEKADWTKIRFSGLLTGTATDVVINIKRNGAWLTA